MVTYNAAHMRVYAAYGAAADHMCEDCGEQAAEWSYNGLDPAAQTDARGRRYSPDPSFYDPRCLRCHHTRDMVMTEPCPLCGETAVSRCAHTHRQRWRYRNRHVKTIKHLAGRCCK